MELNWATPRCFLKAARSLTGSCPSRAGRYSSIVPSLRGQVWTPAASAALPRDSRPGGTGVLQSGHPEQPGSRTRASCHTTGCWLPRREALRAHPPGAIKLCSFWGCVLGVLSKDLPDHSPPGLTQRKTSRLDPHREWI